MNILVTGGAGFIGSHLVCRLLEEGHAVRVIDNLSTGNIKNLEAYIANIDFQSADLRDVDAVKKAVAGCEVVFHQAAIPSVPRSVKNPVETIENNVLGTVVLLKEAVGAGVRRVVYAGSSSAYGNCDALIKGEQILPRVLSPYAAGKLAGEALLQAFESCYDIETVITRYFNVFGERQDETSSYSGVIAKFSKSMLANKAPVIFGDGTQSRDFTHVDNVVHGNLLAGMCESELAKGEVFNIACGGSITLLDLVKKLNAIMGTDVRPTFASPRDGDIKHSRADIGKAKTQLGYEPVVSFEEGLTRTVTWYKEKGSRNSDKASRG